MKKAKLQDLEILRALAILMIVFAHLTPYLTGNFKDLFYSVILTASFSQSGLFLFVFVSGSVLYYYYRNMEVFKEIKGFYS